MEQMDQFDVIAARLIWILLCNLLMVVDDLYVIYAVIHLKVNLILHY